MQGFDMSPSVIIVVNRDSFFLSHRLPLAMALRDRGFNVTIITEDTGHAHKIKNRGFNFIPLPILRGNRNPFREFQTFQFLYKTYRDLRPSIVHHVTPKPVFWGSIAARLLGNIPTINAIVGLGSSLKLSTSPLDLQQMAVKFLYKTALKHPRSTSIFMNPDDLQAFKNFRLLRKNANTVIIRGSGVDLNKFSPRSREDSEIRVMFASRILIDKGFGEYISSARVLKKKYPHVRFIIVGDRDPGNPSNPDERFLIPIFCISEYLRFIV
jgi:glycosyltransferase involved in cell wall biosynthesis